MNDKKDVITYASVAQCAQLVFAIAQPIAKLLDGQISSDLVQKIISAPEESTELKQIIEEITTRIFQIKTDPWKREKEKIEKFYAECFGIKTIDWINTPIPVTDIAGMNRLEFIPGTRITEDQIFEAYAKKFGKDTVWKYYDSISKAIKIQQQRPVNDYCALHKGGTEPDAEHLNESYDDFCNDGNSYMVPKEGMIAAFRYRFETGKMYDVKGATRLHALDSDGLAMGMRRNVNGQFRMCRNVRDGRNSDRGPRQLVF